MADLARIKANVAKMAAQNAPEADIDGYIASEGVTVDDVRNFQSAGVQPPTQSGGPDLGQIVRGSLESSPFGGVVKAAEQVPGALSPNPLDAIASFGNHMFSSVPIAGPYLHGAGEQARAFVQGTTPQAAEAADQARDAQYPQASTAGDIAGPVGAFAAVSRIPGAPLALGLEGSLGSRLGLGVASQYGINTANELTHGKSLGEALKNSILPTAEAAPFMLFGGGKTTRPLEAPATADLQAEAGKLYKAAEDSGVSVNRAGTISLADQMHELARNEGIISPTGRVSTAYPKINEALKTFDDYAAGGSMTVPQIKSVTKTLQDAAGSIEKGERRVGVKMLKQFQNFVASGIPEIAQADPIYARAMRSKTVEKAVQKGAKKGYRKTFQKLADKIDDGKLWGFSAEEKAAIQKAANGSVVPNAISYVGRKLTYGLPALVTGPIGELAKAGGNAMQGKNAKIAAALVRRGGPAPLVDKPASAMLPNALARALLMGAGQ